MSTTNWEIEIGRRQALKIVGLAGAGLAMSGYTSAVFARQPSRSADRASDLVAAFQNPSGSERPGIYWYWMNGNVTREGITADLEAMKDVGLSTVLLFSIGGVGEETVTRPGVESLTPEWWSLVRHAAEEAKRLGLELGLNACDGWATASGPWITPELSMQQVTWSETEITHSSHTVRLAEPASALGFYRDLRVVAFPRPDDWDQSSATRPCRVSATLPVADEAKLLDPSNGEATVISDTDGELVFEFEYPLTVRSVTVRTPAKPTNAGIGTGVERAANSLWMESSQDGLVWQPVDRLAYPRNGWQTELAIVSHAVPETRARFFRFRYVREQAEPFREDAFYGQDSTLTLSSLLLSGRPILSAVPIKSGIQWGKTDRDDDRRIAPHNCVHLDQLIDLSSRLKPDGTLDWAPPIGNWTILRIGHTATGAANSIAGGGRGLECDKMSKAAAKVQFEGWFGEALKQVGEESARPLLSIFHVDSWEAHGQNWTQDFALEFERRRGYDLMPLLAIMCGLPVESAGFSEHVLADVRLTISDLTIENFYGELASLAAARGIQFSAEVANPTYVVDGLEYGRHVDIPMGEFWLRTPINYKPSDIKEAVSAARIYGRRIAGAEAFTEGHLQFDESPRMLRPLGDQNFAEGINRLYLHVYAMQPWLDRAPGMTVSGIGCFFSRTQTWWKPGRAWISYLSRCQAVLQYGVACADVAVFTGEDMPARAILPEDLSDPLPDGYAYDSINRDALMRLASVKDGVMTLPGGASYRMLVLPRSMQMTAELTTRLEELAANGLAIVGKRPSVSPRTSERQGDGATVRSAAARIPVVSLALQSGLEAQLAACGVQPDVLLAKAGLKWLHRKGPDWDAYFFVNPSDAKIISQVSLRALGCPEIWKAETGEIVGQGRWEHSADRTILTLDVEALSSIILILRRDIHFDAVTSVSGEHADNLRFERRNGQLTATSSTAGQWRVAFGKGNVREIRNSLTPDIDLIEPWTVSLADGRPHELTHLASLSASADNSFRHFSGTAIYRTRFIAAPAADLRWMLDLGEVWDLAEITLNGMDLGVVWAPPFKIDLSSAIKTGVNQLAISVTNTWRNKLIGDAGRADNGRINLVWPRSVRGKPWLPRAEDPLLPSGLIGPVRIAPERRFPLPY